MKMKLLNTKLQRTLVIAVPVVLLAIGAVAKLVVAVIRDIIYFAFNWPNYWDTTNEWFSVTEEFKVWQHYWKTGKS